MNNKDLIKILKRFPKTAKVQFEVEKLSPFQQFEITARQDQSSQWTIIVRAKEKNFEENEKSSC
jgi:hypothetical protein